jgi:hypothetical protein
MPGSTENCIRMTSYAKKDSSVEEHLVRGSEYRLLWKCPDEAIWYDKGVGSDMFGPAC